MQRILLVDDHPVIRRGLRQILSDGIAGCEIGEAEDARAALTTLGAGHWDLVVLDLTMPGRSGIDLLAELKHRYPRLPVLVLSVQPEEHYALRSLRAGAAGYLSKDVAPDELVTAVTKVIAGGRYITEWLADRLAELVAGRPVEEPHELLSDREFDIFRAIAAGKPVDEIAREMHLSSKTVSTYRTRMLDKLGVSSDAEVMRYAHARHIL